MRKTFILVIVEDAPLKPILISNTSSSCIDLIFTFQSNLITSGILQDIQMVMRDHYYERSGTTGKQTQGLLDVASNNLIGKEHFQAQALMK